MLIRKNVLQTLTLVLKSLMFWCLVLNNPAFAQEMTDDEVGALIRKSLEEAGPARSMIIAGERLHATENLPVFYTKRAYKPAWFRADQPTPQVGTLLGFIHRLENDGLQPQDYHLNLIQRGLSALKEPVSPGKRQSRSLADLDLLLSDAYFTSATHLLAGKVNSHTLTAIWQIALQETDLSQKLELALKENRIIETLDGLRPRNAGYQRLKKARVLYQSIVDQGGWPLTKAIRPLKRGERLAGVATLRKRLEISDDLQGRSQEGMLFDRRLEVAVRKFQKRHGLRVTGIVDPLTLIELNVPARSRLRQIVLNLERWRWLPLDLGNRYLLINIAAFELEIFEKDRSILKQKVIVGKPFKQTPVFSDLLTYLVLSPYWKIPPQYALTEILPEIQKDLSYLTRKHLSVLRGWSEENEYIDPDAVNWDQINEQNMVYRFQQDPGPFNPLGQIKFMLPNEHDVYLHDTPDKRLFLKRIRSDSSGCIRVEDPMELALYLLKDQKKWSQGSLLAAIDRNQEITIGINDPLPVHFLYWTSWVAADETVHFRKDLYARDIQLDEAIREQPPGKQQ